MLIRGNQSQQPVQIQLPGIHPNAAVGFVRPFLAGTVSVQFHAVLVGIVEVNRLGYAMIRRAPDGVVRVDEALEGYRQIAAGGVQNRRMKQPRRLCRSRLGAFTLPRIQADVVVVAARRDKRRLVTLHRSQLKTRQITVKPQRPVEVGYFQMDMPNARLGRNGVGCRHKPVTFVKPFAFLRINVKSFQDRISGFVQD